MQAEVNDFVAWVRQELSRASQDGWQERLQRALVKLPPTPLARAAAEGTPAPPSAIPDGSRPRVDAAAEADE
jgi:hypothetical protein